MKLRTCACALSLLAAPIAATAATATTAVSSPAAVALAEGRGVRIARNVFVDGDGRPHDTAEGILEIDPARLAAATGLGRGYVHLVTDRGAVASNVPFDTAPDAALPPRLQRLGVRGDGAVYGFQVPFALASDAPIASLKARVVVTAAPIFDAKTFDALVLGVRAGKWLVEALPEAVGGDGPGKVQAPAQPPLVLPASPPNGGDYAPGFEPDWQYIEPHPLNVEAAKNQCVPAAFANALAYLDATYAQFGIDFPQEHIPGVGVDGDETSLVSRMDWYVDRPATDNCIGDTTIDCNTYGDENPSSSIRGIFEFLAAFDGPRRIEVSHQALQPVLPTGCGLDAPIDRESHGAGAQVTFDWLCDRIADGDAVVMALGYYQQAQNPGDIQQPGDDQSLWQRTGGHMLRVFGCGEIGGKRFIRTLDDGKQDSMIDTDGDDEADTCMERDGLRQQLWFLDQGSIEGRLLMGSSFRQIEFAMALTPDL